MGTWVGMVFVAAAAIWGLGNLGDCPDDLKTNLMLFCVANVILALIHSGMSYYMQRQIVEKIGLDKDYKSMTAKEIQEKAGEILLYDVPVCLYAFLAAAGWGMQLWAFSLDSCNKQSPQTASAGIYIVWAACAFRAASRRAAPANAPLLLRSTVT